MDVESSLVDDVAVVFLNVDTDMGDFVDGVLYFVCFMVFRVVFILGVEKGDCANDRVDIADRADKFVVDKVCPCVAIVSGVDMDGE